MAAPATNLEQPAPHQYGRPGDIEDASNRYLIHPLSDKVVTLAHKLKLTPNSVSFLGLGCGLVAAVLYYQLPNVVAVVGGFLAMLGWHIFDGADGKLARLTGQTSAFGRIIDGICDHLVFGAVYIALVMHLMSTSYAPYAWWLAIGAGLSHALQAAGYEERRQKYQRRLKGQARENIEKALLTIDGKRSFLAGLYDSAQKLVSGGASDFDTALAALRQTDVGCRKAAQLVSQTVPMVRAWGILNANNRTFLICIFALVDQPALYFLFEIIVLNLVLLALMVAEHRQENALGAQISLADF
ncbi:MAG: CDP-alcohol phosphatidyltransferase family protein [Alphaproteobacteria bacterium]|nr:CDP-alcohol phosphatidyltransferase family protein [Alphaproteobacteria bacterium]